MNISWTTSKLDHIRSKQYHTDQIIEKHCVNSKSHIFVQSYRVLMTLFYVVFYVALCARSETVSSWQKELRQTLKVENIMIISSKQ